MAGKSAQSCAPNLIATLEIGDNGITILFLLGQLSASAFKIGTAFKLEMVDM